MVEGLGDIINGALLERIHRRTHAGVAGHDQYRGGGRQLNERRARLPRQAQVADDEVKVAERLRAGLFGAGRFADAVVMTFQ